MQKITYENYSNGLSVSFANDSPQSFLAAFDGNSVGSTAITYKPAEFDGERFISANLNSRTITFTAEWYGVRDGRLSVERSYRKWEQLQSVFVPGNMGKLTWTNGSEARFIECRTSELPNFTRVIGNKLSAEFKLVADYPYWQDVRESSFDLTGFDLGSFIITNDSSVPVPFIFACRAGALMLGNFTAGSTMRLKHPGGGGLIEVDTRRCTVTMNGELCNHYLSANSDFFKLLPGDNQMAVINLGAEINNSVFRWHNHYLGVNC